MFAIVRQWFQVPVYALVPLHLLVYGRVCQSTKNIVVKSNGHVCLFILLVSEMKSGAGALLNSKNNIHYRVKAF